MSEALMVQQLVRRPMAAVAPVPHALPIRFRLAADLTLAAWTPGTEDAAGRGLVDVGDLAGQQDPRARSVGIGHRRRREQGFCIGMHRPAVEALGIALLDDLA